LQNSITIHELAPIESSDYVDLKRVHYTQNGIKKAWDIAQVHDSVAILLYDQAKESFVLVKQLRPAVYLKNNIGYTYELCAGIVDKELTLEEIAKEEIFEECGYDIPTNTLERITSFYTSVGFAGSVQTLYFAYVDDTQKVSEGGGVDIEEIEVIYLPKSEAKTFMYNEDIAKTPGLMFAFSWFFEHKDQ
jgi:UDP-sugar diphosphatase